MLVNITTAVSRKEKKMWRRADKEAGEVGINFKTLEAGIHFKLDFRPENREEWKPRHFLPTDWPEKDSPRGKNQIALSRYLGELARKAEEAYEAYKAAHPRPQKETPVTESTVTTEPIVVAEPPVPAPKKATKKTAERDPEKAAKAKIAKVKGGRAGAKVEDQQAAEEETRS